MNVEHVLHMVGGKGGTSYAANSRLQENAMRKAKFLVQETISHLYCALPQQTFAVADLGCSSGPNTLSVVSTIIETISDTCCRLGQTPPEVQFFLNDLPGNDFNAIFSALPAFEDKVKEERVNKVTVPFYIAGVPGSFYGKLFPDKSIHFTHSSYSLHFLSQVPRILGDDGNIVLNKWNVYISRTSPPSVFDAYLEQFKRDFSVFLELRSKEIIPGGRVVLTLLGRKETDASNGKYFSLWDLLAVSLNAMVLEGTIQEEDVHTFNMPFYAPSMEEIKEVIQHDGSFDLKQELIFETNWDGYDDEMEGHIFNCFKSGENVANSMRAVLEPLVTHHFGEAILDELFTHYGRNITKHLVKEKDQFLNFVISLEKRA